MVAVLEATEVVGRNAPFLSNPISLLAVLGFKEKRSLLPEPVPTPVTVMPIPVKPPPAVVESVKEIFSPVVTWPLPALAVIVLLMAVPEVSELPVTEKMVSVSAVELIENVPADDWESVTERFGMVTSPVPKVTGRLVVVLMPRVESASPRSIIALSAARLIVAPLTVRFPPRVVSPVPVVIGRLVVVLSESVDAVVRSMTGSTDAIFVVMLLRVTFPVPVERVLEPVTEIGPLREIAPVPVEKVLAPVWEKLLSSVVAPCNVSAPGVVAEPMVLIELAPAPKVLVVPAPVASVVLPVEARVSKVPPPEKVVAPVMVVAPTMVVAPVMVVARSEVEPIVCSMLPLTLRSVKIASFVEN